MFSLWLASYAKASAWQTTEGQEKILASVESAENAFRRGLAQEVQRIKEKCRGEP